MVEKIDSLTSSEYTNGFEVVKGFIDVKSVADLKDIFSNAINNYEALDRIVNNIEFFQDQFFTDLDVEKFRDVYLKQLNLDENKRSDHRHIVSNILFQYKFINDNFNYSVKELILLVIANNDKLTEKYKDVLFAKENLSLLHLAIGSQKYLEIFIEQFPDLYQSLKDKTVELNESHEISFFSVIALRKEKALLDTVLVDLDTVLVDYALKDLTKILQEFKSYPIYGILETASLVENKEFIKIVLNAIEKDQDQEELLKNSLITIFDTAISQEHDSIIHYLCSDEFTTSKESLYNEVLSDDNIIKQFKKQILGKINSAVGIRKEQVGDILNDVFKIAIFTRNTYFIQNLFGSNDNELSNLKEYFTGDLYNKVLNMMEDISTNKTNTSSSNLEGETLNNNANNELGAINENVQSGNSAGAVSNLLNTVTDVAITGVEMVVELISPNQNHVYESINSQDTSEEFEELPTCLNFNKFIDIINKLVNESELNNIIYDERFINDLNDENLKNFCLNQLGLDLEGKHKCVYDKILTHKIDENIDLHNYSVSELVLLKVAANDELAGQYKDMLRTQFAKLKDDLFSRLLVGVAGEVCTKNLLQYLETTLTITPPFEKICTVLNLALSVQNETCVQSIIDKFADKEVLKPGFTSNLLHHIIYYHTQKDNNSKLIEKLLTCKKNVKDIDIDGKNALFWARDLQVLRLLLEKGKDIIDVDKKDNRCGRTALHWSASEGKLEKVKLLIKNGADFNIKDDDGKTALDLARQTLELSNEDKDKVEKVINFFEKEVEIEKNRTPIHYAVLKNNLPTLESLLKKENTNQEKYYDINARDSDDWTSLGFAIRDSKFDYVKILTDNGADVNIKTRNDETHLNWAIQRVAGRGENSHQWKIFKLILDKVNDIDRASLKCAIVNGDCNIVALLVNNGAKVDEEIVRYAEKLTNDTNYRNKKEEHKKVYDIICEHYKNNEQKLNNDLEHYREDSIISGNTSSGREHNKSNNEGIGMGKGKSLKRSTKKTNNKQNPVNNNIENQLVATDVINKETLERSGSQSLDLGSSQSTPIPDCAEHLLNQETVLIDDSQLDQIYSDDYKSDDQSGSNNEYLDSSDYVSSQSTPIINLKDDNNSDNSKTIHDESILDNNNTLNAQDSPSDDDSVSKENTFTVSENKETLERNESQPPDLGSSQSTPTSEAVLSDTIHNENSLGNNNTLNAQDSSSASSEKKIERNESQSNGTVSLISSNHKQNHESGSNVSDFSNKSLNSRRSSTVPILDDKPQNTQRSKLATVVISTLVLAAVASVAISVYLEMLMIGVAVGAVCLIAAALTYCCTKPASTFESNDKAATMSGSTSYGNQTLLS